MSMNTIPIDLDRHRLLHLLELYHQKTLTREQALELEPLIERIWKNALEMKDYKTAAEMSTILVALNAYIAGRVSLYEPPRIDRISIS